MAIPPILISFLVTPIRFSLEMMGIPENFIFLIGLLWLTLAFVIYWSLTLYKEKGIYLKLALALTIFSPISRIPVFILWWIDKKWEIGSHYGDYFDYWPKALLNHIVGGGLVQIIPGLVIGFIMLSYIREKRANSET